MVFIAEQFATNSNIRKVTNPQSANPQMSMVIDWDSTTVFAGIAFDPPSRTLYAFVPAGPAIHRYILDVNGASTSFKIALDNTLGYTTTNFLNDVVLLRSARLAFVTTHDSVDQIRVYQTGFYRGRPIDTISRSRITMSMTVTPTTLKPLRNTRSSSTTVTVTLTLLPGPAPTSSLLNISNSSGNSSAITAAPAFPQHKTRTPSFTQTYSISATDRFAAHVKSYEFGISNETFDFVFQTKGFMLMSAGDPHYVTADDRLITCDEYGPVVMGESREFHVEGFHVAYGEATLLSWVNVTHRRSGASVLFQPGGPIVSGALRNDAIVTQTAIATLDGNEYVEVTFTETPQGPFASAVAILPVLGRGIWLRGCRTPFETTAALDVAECRDITSAHIKRMCNIDAYRLGKGFAQLTTAMQTLTNNVKIVQASNTTNGTTRAPGAALLRARSEGKAAPPVLTPGAIAGIVIASVVVLCLAVAVTCYLLRKDAHAGKKKRKGKKNKSNKHAGRYGDSHDESGEPKPAGHVIVFDDGDVVGNDEEGDDDDDDDGGVSGRDRPSSSTQSTDVIAEESQ